MDDGLIFICIIVGMVIGAGFWNSVDNPKITPKLYESAAKVCEVNDGLKVLDADGGTECNNGARFEVGK